MFHWIYEGELFTFMYKYKTKTLTLLQLYVLKINNILASLVIKTVEHSGIIYPCASTHTLFPAAA